MKSYKKCSHSTKSQINIEQLTNYLSNIKYISEKQKLKIFNNSIKTPDIYV